MDIASIESTALAIVARELAQESGALGELIRSNMRFKKGLSGPLPTSFIPGADGNISIVEASGSSATLRFGSTISYAGILDSRQLFFQHGFEQYAEQELQPFLERMLTAINQSAQQLFE